MNTPNLLVISLVLFLGSTPAFSLDRPLVSIGFAKVDVTPTTPVVLAGYGSRKTPYDSIETTLWARAMVIGDENPVAFVVLDNCGITQKITDQVKSTLTKRGFQFGDLNVATTHTHNAPSLTGYAPILWQGRMSPDQIRETEKYTQFAIQRMCDAVLAANKNKSKLRLPQKKSMKSSL